MKLLFDQNISRKLVDELTSFFPDSTHVYLIGLHESSDDEIWHYAKNNQYVIVTQDSDFNERSTLYGYPPKIIWLRTGNTTTEHILALLKNHHNDIILFEKDVTLGCLQIY